MAEDTAGRECPHDDFGIRPRTGMTEMSEHRVPMRNIESPYGGGVRFLPGAAGNRLPVMFPTAPVLTVNKPQLGSWRVAVVQVEETPAGDASGPECPRAEQNRQWPIDLSQVAGNVRPALPAGGSPLAGLVKSVGPLAPVGYHLHTWRRHWNR